MAGGARDGTPCQRQAGKATAKHAAEPKAAAAQLDKPEVPAVAAAVASGRGRGMRVVSGGANLVVVLIGLFCCNAANNFRAILWPKFPDLDPHTHAPIPKHGNVFQIGDTLQAKLWVDHRPWPAQKKPLVEFDFVYEWDGFKAVSREVNASVTHEELARGQNTILSAEVFHAKSGRVVRAQGGLVKHIEPTNSVTKFKLLQGEVCKEPDEPKFGGTRRSGPRIARGIPQMQVRLVYDDTMYPTRQPYVPALFVDEFWLTNEQLVKLNVSGASNFGSQIDFSLMGIARYRFQAHMERSLEQTAKSFGEDSEEMLQVRDLFANTSPKLLIFTMLVMVLEIIFEFLAFKSDVEFFGTATPEMLNKFVSVQSIILGIFMQAIVLLYLWEESTNFLVMCFSLVAIFVDVWKVTRAMRIEWTRRVFGIIPLPIMVARVQKDKADDFDSIAMRWVGLVVSPGVLCYAFYSLQTECYRSWYSYAVTVSALSVYALGFALMTPQLFINYKHKSVAYLPWRKFIYRFIITFIDDLFALIIRMPMMHRLSCFRDDIVFFLYIFQWWLYGADKKRSVDEDGYAVDSADGDGCAQGGKSTQEAKKDK